MNTRDKSRPVKRQSRPASRPSAGGSRPKRAAASQGNVATQTKQRRRSPTPKQPTPDVVYTQPGPFNRNRFLLRLATIVAVVLALLFGMSIFFKVKTVTVAGANKYTAWDIREASGIQEGENLLTISEAKLSSNIKSKLPYVDTVRIGIKLPDTVKIEIEELDVVYAIEAVDGSWWLMRADGGIVEKTNSADAELYTKVLGVQIAEPTVGEQAQASQPEPEETTADGQTVSVTVKASEQMSTAISILQFMESSGVIGEIASVNVADTGNLEMWYGDRFQVILGDSTQLAYKIKLVKTAVGEYMESYDSGILDVSLTIQPDPEQAYQVIYSPFN